MNVLGDKASAAFMEKQMLSGENDSENKCIDITHPASKQERKKIREKTGKTAGEMPKNAGT